MADFAEIALAHAKERAAIDLGIPADIIMQARVETLAVPAVPGFLRLVGAVHEHRLGIPVGARARQVAAALDEQDALARRREACLGSALMGPKLLN